MSKLTVDRHKNKKLTREELHLLSKEDLVETIIQYQAHTLQLRNIISKKNNEQRVTKASKKTKKGRQFDFDKWQTRRILLRVGYFGSNYRGLAVQEDCPDTIEAHLFNALTKTCLLKSRDTCGYHRCGRTDKGVSASGQVISLEVRSRLTKEQQNSEDGGRNQELLYCKLLNRLLPEDIRAIAWLPLPDTDEVEPYSARFDCGQRTYKYWFPLGSLDLSGMIHAASFLRGSHDFRNLCKMDVANGVTCFIRHVHAVDIVAEKKNQDIDDGYSMYYLKVTANAFLWHQIRCMVGILLLVGDRKEDPDIIYRLMDIQDNPRKPQYNMAIEAPLNLFHCAYDILEDNDSIESVTLKDESSNSLTKKRSQEVGEKIIEVLQTEPKTYEAKKVKYSIENDSKDDLNCNKNDEFGVSLNCEESYEPRSNEKILLDNACGTKNKDIVCKNVVSSTESTENCVLSTESQVSSTKAIISTKMTNNHVLSAKISENMIANDVSSAKSIKKCVPSEANYIGSVKYDDFNGGNNSSDVSMEDNDEGEVCMVEKEGRVVKKDWWFIDLEDLALVIKNFQSQWTKASVQASMIKDVIHELEGLYNKEAQRLGVKLTTDNQIEDDRGNITFKSQTDCLLQGVKAKVYQPLLERTKCKSLENRIEHYVKKKRLRRSSNNDEEA